jgi:hypothetical protein
MNPPDKGERYQVRLARRDRGDRGRRLVSALIRQGIVVLPTTGGLKMECTSVPRFLERFLAGLV